MAASANSSSSEATIHVHVSQARSSSTAARGPTGRLEPWRMAITSPGRGKSPGPRGGPATPSKPMPATSNDAQNPTSVARWRRRSVAAVMFITHHLRHVCRIARPRKRSAGSVESAEAMVCVGSLTASPTRLEPGSIARIRPIVRVTATATRSGSSCCCRVRRCNGS